MEPIVVEGVVTQGRKLGRRIGFPTANVAVSGDLQAEDGVYRSRIEVGGVWYDGMSNLGYNPTVGGNERRLETHIFDFEGEIYGHEIRVELCEKIRDEQTFSSVDELCEQINKDKAYILKYR